VGETAADTRQEIEETRSELDGTLRELRARSAAVRGRAVKVAAFAASGIVATGAVTAVVFLTLKRRGGALTQAARRLPQPPKHHAVPAARNLERWMERRSKRLEKQREEVLEALSHRIAQHQAEAERRANPLWRRTTAKALETAATVGVSTFVRRLVSPAGADG
jgi:hypothetical protein